MIVRSFLFLSILVFLGNCKSQNTKVEEDKKTEVKSDNVDSVKTILFFGNSITAGYGLELTEAFPALLQKKLDSLNLEYKTINAGVSGETSAGGLSRIDWALKQKVDVFVLELGANDGLRGIKLSETKKNLQGIIDKVKAKYPDVKIVIAGMEIPPSMGKEYTLEFREMYKDLAGENNLALIPFLLEGVAGEPHLNLPDGIHPTAEGHTILAKNVWSILKDII